MPAYYNPYNFFPATYGNMYAQPIPQQNLGQPQGMVDVDLTMKWVEGEVGAKAFQMPQGWPTNRPIALWDSTDTVIWLKSWNQLGVPNPMQKLKYELPEQAPVLPAASGQSKSAESSAIDMSQYVTKNDLAQLKEEIQNMLKFNQNGSQQVQNRGANK